MQLIADKVILLIVSVVKAMVYVWLTGTPRVRRFLKKTAVPGVFQWAKSKTTAQLRREERQRKRHEVEKVKAATQWATVKAEEAEEEEKNRLYACEEFHVVAEEEVCSASCTLIANGEAESKSCSAYNNVCSDSSCSTASFLFPTATVATEGNDRENVCVHKGNEAAPAGIEKEPYLSVNAIKHSDKLLHFYTGLENYDVFLHAYLSGRQC